MAGREISDEPDLFLTTLAPTSGQRRSAVAVVVALLILFGIAAPFAAVQLPRSPAFVTFQQGILCISDLITAVMLFSQFSFIRSRTLLVLASGYLFTALIVIPHTLTFPGAFTPTGLLGAGRQSTAWLYIFWHLGFPLSLLAYAWLKDERSKKYVKQVSTLSAICRSAAIVIVLVFAFTLLATVAEEFLPRVLDDDGRLTSLAHVDSPTLSTRPLAHGCGVCVAGGSDTGYPAGPRPLRSRLLCWSHVFVCHFSRRSDGIACADGKIV